MICEQCKSHIKREKARREGKRVNCLCYGCDRYPQQCSVADIVSFTHELYQPERLNPEAPKGDAIV